jgi:tetratricopeptide (TPR) repeat protein
MSVSKRFLVLALTLGLWAGPPQAATFDVDDLSKPAPAPEARGAAPALAGIGAKLDAQGKLELLKAIQLFGKGEYVPAEAIARRLTEVSPEEPDAWYLLGLLLANMDQREDAVKALDEAASRYTTNADPLIFKGDLELSLGQTEAAISTWESAALRDPANWRAQERLAAIAEQQGNLAEAARRYDLSIRESGALRSFPRLQLSRLALLEGRPEQVEPLLKELAATENAPDAALDYLARALIGQDRLAEAEPLLNRLVERGTSPRAFPHLARIYIAQGKGAEAEALMARAAAAFPDDGGIMLEQGRILGAVGKYDQALAAFERGLSRYPENRALLNAASLAKARLGAMDDALALARKAVAAPNAATSDRMWLAALLEQTGAGEEAVPLYREVLKAEPKNWVALNNLASLLTAKAPGEAVTMAEMAASLAPDVAAVRDTLGWAQFKAGRMDAAEATFRGLRKSAPEGALPAYRLGLILAATGKMDEAKALLTEALARDPASPHAELARKALAGQPVIP